MSNLWIRHRSCVVRLGLTAAVLVLCAACSSDSEPPAQATENSSPGESSAAGAVGLLAGPDGKPRVLVESCDGNRLLGLAIGDLSPESRDATPLWSIRRASESAELTDVVVGESPEGFTVTNEFVGALPEVPITVWATFESTEGERVVSDVAWTFEVGALSETQLYVNGELVAGEGPGPLEALCA